VRQLRDPSPRAAGRALTWRGRCSRFAGEARLSPELIRGIDHLTLGQQADVTWNETHFTGTGFPRHFYLRYYMYRNYFPLMALGLFRSRAEAAASARPAEGQRA
jgi:squalene-hopene/tetraprenyl-beta-curcumene cyclase